MNSAGHLDRMPMNCNLRTLLTSIGIVLLPLGLIPVGLHAFLVLAAGSGESVSVRHTGMVTHPEILEWSPWQEGLGNLTLLDYMPREMAGATPLAHRVGTNTKWVSVLTLYQVQFRKIDGETAYWAAHGPSSLISVNQPRAWGLASLLLLPSAACFLAAWRIGREQQVTDPGSASSAAGT